MNQKNHTRPHTPRINAKSNRTGLSAPDTYARYSVHPSPLIRAAGLLGGFAREIAHSNGGPHEWADGATWSPPDECGCLDAREFHDALLALAAELRTLAAPARGSRFATSRVRAH